MKNFNKKTSLFGCFFFTMCITTQISAMDTNENLETAIDILRKKQKEFAFARTRLYELPATTRAETINKHRDLAWYAFYDLQLQKHVIEQICSTNDAKNAAIRLMQIKHS